MGLQIQISDKSLHYATTQPARFHATARRPQAAWVSAVQAEHDRAFTGAILIDGDRSDPLVQAIVDGLELR